MKTQPKEDKDLINNEDYWPQWPYLPIKRYKGNDMQCAFLCAGNSCIIYFGNIWNSEHTKNIVALNKIEYKNIDELLADGWIVD